MLIINATPENPADANTSKGRNILHHPHPKICSLYPSDLAANTVEKDIKHTSMHNS